MRLTSVIVAIFTLFVAELSVAANQSANEDFVWNNGLRKAHFGDRAIIESNDVIRLVAPKRAEDASIVPIRIQAQFEQTEARYIKSVSLIIDQNPGPLAARFEFTPRSGRADLAMRVRVNAYTPMRAIAETNDGQLHMSRLFVKASGGCSAPAAGNLEQALTRMGKIRFKTNDPTINQPTLVQLNISHPNITGMQMDQVTQLYRPAHFVNRLSVEFNGEPVLTGQTDIAISEDPSFRFYFVPDQPGELSVTVTDNTDKSFHYAIPVAPQPNS